MNKNCLIFAVIFFLILALIIFITSYLGKTLSENPKVFVKGKITSSIIDKDQNNLIFYDSGADQISKINLKNLKTTTILKPNLGTISNIIFSPDGKKSIAITSEKVYEIDLESKQQKELDQNIESVIWQNDSQKIIYHLYNPDSGYSVLGRSNPDGSGKEILKSLQDFSEYNLSVSNDNSKILYYTPPSDVGGTNLYLYDLDSGQTRILIKDYSAGGGIIFEDKILYEKLNSSRSSYSIFLESLDGTNSTSLNLNSSLDKIAKNTIDNYIIATTTSEDGNDNIYKISLSDHSKVPILESTAKQNYHVSDLELASDKKILSFINKDGINLMKIK